MNASELLPHILEASPVNLALLLAVIAVVVVGLALFVILRITEKGGRE